MKHLERVRPNSIVEVGCGLGAMAYRLASQFEYRGYEPDHTSFEVAASRLAELGRGEVINGPFPAHSDREFGALCAFEVLEHVEDDVAALASWAGWVESEGIILLSTPANPSRFGSWDEAVGHYRRYDREGLRTVMKEAGVEPVEVVAWGMPIGHLLELGRNLVAGRVRSEMPVPEKTASSGRLYQPSGRLGRVTEVVMWPFAQIQKPFARTDHGIGFVAVGQVNH